MKALEAIRQMQNIVLINGDCELVIQNEDEYKFEMIEDIHHDDGEVVIVIGSF